jgi:lycopene cyclase domain-containing protein
VNYTYLLINAASLSVPLAFSFHPRIRFNRVWFAAIPAIAITAIAFLLWDALFTFWGVWGFNPRYLTGVAIGNLPVEEVLFFFCIPYSCLFTHYSLRILRPARSEVSNQKSDGFLLATAALILAALFYDRLYTFSAAVSVASLLLFNSRLQRRVDIRTFLSTYVLLLIPFFIVNGILTGTGIPEEVVWYNDTENVTLRVGTIPVEDFLYGFSMIFMNVLLFERFLPKTIYLR